MHDLARRQGHTPPPNRCGLKNKTVLLLEPDLDLRLMLNLLLTEDGCTVDACGSLVEALLAISEKHFDFVITHGTPGIDGLLLLDVLRERGCATPSVVISARYEKEPYLLAKNLGALDYFTTPLDYAALQRLIRGRT
jgi:DNA-binding response OmpR family regulator